MAFWEVIGALLLEASKYLIEEIIVRGSKKILEWMFSDNTKKLIKAPPYKEDKATMNETKNMNEILTNVRTEFKTKVSETEQGCVKHAEKHFSDILNNISELDSQFGCNINRNYLIKLFNDYISDLQGSLAENINKRLTISDKECNKILQLTGDKKETEMEKYIFKILSEGIDKYIVDYRRVINDAIEIITHSIQIQLNDKESEVNNIIKEVSESINNSSLDRKNRRKALFEKKKILLNDFNSAILSTVENTA